jgi:hypothetical protein
MTAAAVTTTNLVYYPRRPLFLRPIIGASGWRRRERGRSKWPTLERDRPKRDRFWTRMMADPWRGQTSNKVQKKDQVSSQTSSNTSDMAFVIGLPPPTTTRTRTTTKTEEEEARRIRSVSNEILLSERAKKQSLVVFLWDDYERARFVCI